MVLNRTLETDAPDTTVVDPNPGVKTQVLDASLLEKGTFENKFKLFFSQAPVRNRLILSKYIELSKHKISSLYFSGILQLNPDLQSPNKADSRWTWSCHSVCKDRTAEILFAVKSLEHYIGTSYQKK
jgi:hypothetical protein